MSMSSDEAKLTTIFAVYFQVSRRNIMLSGAAGNKSGNMVLPVVHFS